MNAGQHAFCYRGVKIWDNLSKDLREIINTKVFKRRLINELISNTNYRLGVEILYNVTF